MLGETPAVLVEGVFRYSVERRAGQRSSHDELWPPAGVGGGDAIKNLVRRDLLHESGVF
jgi:hypothetical protein